MSDKELAAFHEQARLTWGIDAVAAEAQSRGSSLMIKLPDQGYAVPLIERDYPEEFVEAVRERQLAAFAGAGVVPTWLRVEVAQ